MIKKGRPMQLKPGTDSEVVYRLIEAGVSSVVQLRIRSRLPHIKVSRAVWNLSHTGMIEKEKVGNVFRYTITNKQPRGIATETFAGIAFVFQHSCKEK